MYYLVHFDLRYSQSTCDGYLVSTSSDNIIEELIRETERVTREQVDGEPLKDFENRQLDEYQLEIYQISKFDLGSNAKIKKSPSSVLTDELKNGMTLEQLRRKLQENVQLDNLSGGTANKITIFDFDGEWLVAEVNYVIDLKIGVTT